MLDLNDVPIDTHNYIANQKVTIDLPTDYALHSIRSRLTGRATISGGTMSGTPWDENPLTLIDYIRIYGSKAGGSVEVINLGAADLYRMVHILNETAGSLTNVSSGAAASYDFIADILIPLHVFGKKIADHWKAMSLLPAWLFSELKMEVKFKDGSSVAGGTAGGLINGGDRTVAISAYGGAGGVPSLTNVAIQAVNIDKARHRPMLMKLYKKTCVTEAVEPAHKENLNKGNYYRGFLFRAYSANGQNAPSDAICSNVALKIANQSKKDWPFLQLKDDNKTFYGLESAPTGYAMMDFCKSGTLKTMLDTRQYSNSGTSFNAILNIPAAAAGNRVDIISMEVMDAGDW